MEAFQRHMERLPEVGATSSIVDILPSMVSFFHHGDPKAELIPTDARMLGFFLTLLYTSGDPGDRDHFLTPDLKHANITLYLRDHKGETLRRVIEHARAFFTRHPLSSARFRLAAGYGGLLAALNEDIAALDVHVTLAAFVGVLLCCALAHRSLVAGVLYLLPLLLSNAMTYALMGALGIGLDVHTLPVVALGVGLGVDYGLYVVAAVGERFRACGEVERALSEGLVDAGRGVLATGLTMTLGLLPWWFSFLRFQAEMGLMLLFWMLVSMLGAMVLLPAVLARFRPRFLFGGGGSAAPRGALPEVSPLV